MHYSTEARRRILSLFGENAESSFSTADILTALPDIPKSSVYRVVDSLEEDGRIMRVGVSRRRAAFYQLSDSAVCARHMHLRCSLCGRTVHMDETTTRAIENIIEEKYGYGDCVQSVMMGKCPSCLKKEK